MRLHTTLIVPLLAVTACAPVVDGDGDGLADSWELEVGLDPETDDTDGDGWTDFEEVHQFTDGDDPDSMPYEGGWDRQPVPDDLDGFGTTEGDTLADATMTDQFGEQVDLHHFYGNVILVESGAEWCGPCNEAAPEAEEHYQEYRDEGFLVLHWLGEDANGQPATEDTAARWAETHGLHFPVLADPNWSVGNPIERDNNIPTFHLIGRDMTLRVIDGFVGTSQIEAALAEPVPEVSWDAPPDLDDAAPARTDAPNPLDAPISAPFGGCQAGGGRGGWAVLLLALLRRRR